MNFAIIGCGFIAKKHAQAIENIPSANLVAICDIYAEAMNFYSDTYGTTAYTDASEMLHDESIDVVCICTPSGLHASIAEQVAKAKKHIVLEKPIAMTIEETNRIIDAAKSNGVKLTVVHPNRFRPVVQELHKILDQGLLGQVSHANCIVNWNRNQEYYSQATWRGKKEYDGGVLMNQAIHNLDLLLWFMGEPKRVFSMEATRLHKIEAEDVSTGVIGFESGAIATVQASTTVYSKNYEESITIFGEKGTVKIGGPSALFFEHIEIEALTVTETKNLIEKVKNDPWGVPGHQRIIEDIIDAIQNDRNPTITGEDGRRALQLVLTFYESAKKNAPVLFN